MTKILFIDIENSPNISYTWGKYDQDVVGFKKEWYMLSFAYKWSGGRTRAHSLPDFDTYTEDKADDFPLLRILWELLDEADIIVGHNLDRFDLRKINARFLFHGFSPPSPYQTVDTYKLAKRYFFLNSNKLNDISEYLGIGKKVETGGFQLWLDCMAGESKAWKRMVKYNKHDVDLTEKVYNVLKTWSTSHPNVNVLTGTLDACPICGKKKLQRRGYSITRVGRKQRYQCMECAGWSTGKPEKVLEIR